MRNYNVLYSIIIILIILCVFLLNRTDKITKIPEGLIPALTLSSSYLNNTALLSSGVNFKTNKVLVLNNLTGKEIEPCNKGGFLKNNKETQYTQKPNSTCNLTVNNPSEVFKAGIEATNKIIDVELLKNGKKIPGKAIFEVKVLYNGSMCTTQQIRGIQRTVCIEEINYCQSMYKTAESLPEPYKSGVINYLVSIGCAKLTDG